ncbi:hypothetical protein VOLCADRAFT_88930 [Volvox carteri f. nagariensis]|uniref:Uncharacterized protein n=1 Tax=Volvox carteri f. nagariensis TaxID=3068 RepID=D8TQC2_VOLCA|nr:uncharacterized protein VOLCADRAFT_88930 [Volvox carteri f. nagariensis]EFJ50379.1 hypothetical protein VOLCADRAFT_88930 [Volvox carteri f. nagariensis]|eukprot:XP_002948504.1 hypothetical protein VOLCADRAFT_88930 [Volvox carteri f. nagariensis]
MKPSLRVDIAAAEAAAASDVQDTDNEPHRLLKLSHSLRYQLAQPPRSRTAQRVRHEYSIAGATKKHLGRVHMELRFCLACLQTTSRMSHYRYLAPFEALLNPREWSCMNPLFRLTQGTSTASRYTRPVDAPRRQPVTAFPAASPHKRPRNPKRPLRRLCVQSMVAVQTEFRQDLDELRQHVDEYVTKREHRAFDLERTAFKAEIAHLRKRLGESEDRVVKLQTMLPDHDGEFRGLRAEVEELEREADHFCDLYEREAKATSSALEGFRQALGDINDIEMEFQRIKQILDNLPQAAPGQPGQTFGATQLLAPGMAAHQNGVRVAAPGGTPEQPEAASSRVCCGFIRITRRGGQGGAR